MRYSVSIAGKTFEVDLIGSRGSWECAVNGRKLPLDVREIGPGSLSLLLDGKSYAVRREPEHVVFVNNRPYPATVEDPRSWRGRQGRDSSHAGPQKLTSSMPGKVVRILAREGEQVQAGQGIVVLEAMKMQNEIMTPKAGTLQKLHAREGANVNPGETLAIID
jgi:biotin carboxyl carrier protein